MDIQVNKFREALGLLKTVVPRKPAMASLTSILVCNRQIMATDLETMVIVPVAEADITCLLPYMELVETLKYVDGGQFIHLEVNDKKVSLKWGDGSVTFDTDEVEDFPAIPDFEPVVEAPVDADTLIPTMFETLTYAATEDSRPVLRGVTLVLGDKLVVAAGDGFRMAYKELAIPFPKEETVIVPTGSVITLKALWEKTPRNPPPADSLVAILTAKKQATLGLNKKDGGRVAFGNYATVIFKRIEGSPPQFVQLIPKEPAKAVAVVLGSQLEVAVRRLAHTARRGDTGIRLSFTEGKVTVTARSDGAETETLLDVLSFKGEPAKTSINPGYLLDYLSGKEGLVTISLRGAASPVVFQHRNSPAVVIMPMMAKA